MAANAFYARPSFSLAEDGNLRDSFNCCEAKASGLGRIKSGLPQNEFTKFLGKVGDAHGEPFLAKCRSKTAQGPPSLLLTNPAYAIVLNKPELVLNRDYLDAVYAGTLFEAFHA